MRDLHGYAGSPITGAEPTGHAIDDGSRMLAVVDVLNGGRVHLNRALADNQSAYFAATAAALLLIRHRGMKRPLADRGAASADARPMHD